MVARTVAVQLPQPLYRKLTRLAKLTGRPLESLVEQTLSVSIPPLPDDLPDDIAKDLTSLEHLDDAALWRVAGSLFSIEKHEQLLALQSKEHDGQITTPERTVLVDLRQEADLQMLRKAYAYVLLKWRGHRLPPLDQLSPNP